MEPINKAFEDIDGNKFVDPVVTMDGQTYSRTFIQDWFKKYGRISPFDHQALTSKKIVQNKTLFLAMDTIKQMENERNHEVEDCRTMMEELISLAMSGKRENMAEEILALQEKSRTDLFHNSWLMLICSAARAGHADLVKMLIENDANINIQDWDGKTALMLASEKGHLAVVEELLQGDAYIDMEDNDDRTALMLASEKGQRDVVGELLKKGPIIEWKGKEGKSALMLASENGHGAVVEALLQKEEAQINAKDRSGKTALMLASENGHLATVDVLLQKNAAIDTQDTSYKTALMLATENGYGAVVEALLQQGAKASLRDINDNNALDLVNKLVVRRSEPQLEAVANVLRKYRPGV